MAWGYAIAAAASYLAASNSASASGQAASDQLQAALASNQLQANEFSTIQGEYGPQRNIGYGADTLLAQLYGIPNPNAPSTSAMYPANANYVSGTGGSVPFGVGGGAGGGGAGGGGSMPFGIGPIGRAGAGAAPSAAPTTGTPNFSNFYNAPNYQFALQQGENAVNRNAAAGGNLYSTNTLNSLDQFAQGTASQQYNNYVQQLMGLAGLGGQATAGTASAAQATGNNISAGLLSAGNANASGALGQAGAWNSLFGSKSFQGNVAGAVNGFTTNSNVGSVSGAGDRLDG